MLLAITIVICLAIIALIIYTIYKLGRGSTLVPGKPGVKPVTAKALARRIEQLAEHKDIAILKPKGANIELDAKGFSAFISFDTKKNVLRYYEKTCKQEHATMKRSIRDVATKHGWGFQQHWFRAGL